MDSTERKDEQPTMKQVRPNANRLILWLACGFFVALGLAHYFHMDHQFVRHGGFWKYAQLILPFGIRVRDALWLFSIPVVWVILASLAHPKAGRSTTIVPIYVLSTWIAYAVMVSLLHYRTRWEVVGGVGECGKFDPPALSTCSQSATLIVDGQFQSLRDVGTNGIATIRVDDVYKGSYEGELTIKSRSFHSRSRWTPVFIDRGRRYIFFLARKDDSEEHWHLFDDVGGVVNFSFPVSLEVKQQLKEDKITAESEESTEHE